MNNKFEKLYHVQLEGRISHSKTDSPLQKQLTCTIFQDVHIMALRTLFSTNSNKVIKDFLTVSTYLISDSFLNSEFPESLNLLLIGALLSLHKCWQFSMFLCHAQKFREI